MKAHIETASIMLAPAARLGRDLVSVYIEGTVNGRTFVASLENGNNNPIPADELRFSPVDRHGLPDLEAMAVQEAAQQLFDAWQAVGRPMGEKLPSELADRLDAST